jgi:acetyl esterase
MPLDPLVKGFLDQLADTPGPKIFELSPVEGRALFAAMMELVGPKDEPVGKVENLAMPAPHGDIGLRCYTPVAADAGPLPALAFFHGGGFVIGDLDTHDGICRQLVNEGEFKVIAVNYRLAPEHKFPAAVEDAYAAIQWIEANAAALGVDPNRIGVGGDSAGGGLAAVTAQLAKARSGPKLAFQLLMFPVTQIGGETRSRREFALGYFLDKPTLDWFFGHYGADAADLRASPLHSTDFRGLPPAYLMLGGFDPLRDEGMEYADKLRAAGVRVQVADYPDLVHCFIYMQSVLPQARAAVVAAARSVHDALAGC